MAAWNHNSRGAEYGATAYDGPEILRIFNFIERYQQSPRVRRRRQAFPFRFDGQGAREQYRPLVCVASASAFQIGRFLMRHTDPGFIREGLQGPQPFRSRPAFQVQIRDSAFSGAQRLLHGPNAVQAPKSVGLATFLCGFLAH